MARCMLKGKGMPHNYWGEAVSTATYVLNRCPTKKLKFVTPEEAWSGKKPATGHLRIFGSLCYRLVPDEKRSKLEDKSVVMVLVGYHPTGAYKLHSPIQQKIVFSRFVIIDESASWNWNEEPGKPISGLFMLPNEEEPTASAENTATPVPNSKRRSTRQRQPSTRLAGCEVYSDNAISDEGDLMHFAFLADSKPINWEQAFEEEVWRIAMQEETNAIERNHTWELVDLPTTKHPISVNWVFKTKLKPDGTIA